MSVLEWRNEAQTILAKVDGNHTVIIEPGHDEWAELSARQDIAPFVPLPAPEINPVPDVVSRFQAKAALALAGKLTAAEAAVTASGDVVLQLAWAEANDFRRNSPGINALAPLIGLDAAGLDALFIAAAQIEA